MQSFLARSTLMIQGTTSDAGKTTLVAGLCRVLKRHGIRVAPFKPQNMALNSAVTTDGGEIGRAQALQAQAAGTAPHTDMNPVLLKPNSDLGAQIIIHGKAVANDMQAGEYHDYKRIARDAVLTSYRRLLNAFEVLIVEGAGSPAEINLREGDIANMGFAEEVDCPVILIADIDRGGVFAHLVGTLELLSATEQARVVGFVINRFRGDYALLEPGLRWLEQRTGKPVLGVLPYLHGLQLDSEDSINQSSPGNINSAHSELVEGHLINIIVPVLPHISNHTDFDPLRQHPQLNFTYIGPDQKPPPCDVVILPGSKNVRADLKWLQEQNWQDYLQRHLRYGGKVLGICGGFQMLGQTIHDPLGIEGTAGSSDGLGFLEMDTELQPVKQLRNVNGTLTFGNHESVSGYEIHCGVSDGPALQQPIALLDDGRTDGAISSDGNVIGTYLHGVFESPTACTSLLHWMGLDRPQVINFASLREAALDQLADAVEQHLDMTKVMKLIVER